MGIILLISLTVVIFTFSYRKKSNDIFVYFFSEGGSPVEKIKVKIGDNVNLPTTNREGYKFLGWYKSDIKVSNNTRYYETTTLFAKWVEEGADSFTITFDSDGGTEVEKLIVECNKALKLPLNPIKEGFEFVSWLDNDNNPILEESILKCEDITLKADWKKIEENNVEKKEITYSCPNGYVLKNKRCINEKNPLERCPNNSVLDNDKCYSQVDTNNGNIICNTMDVETEEGIKNIQGEYFNDKCGYYVYSNLGQDDCNYTWDNGKCYGKVTTDGFSRVCSNGYELKDNNCKKVVNKEYYCENGYNLNNNKCVRTIDATIR